jgi:uncharacterized membrane protein
VSVSTHAVPGLRFDRLDALRGIAIIWMAVFHFFFDASYFDLIQQEFKRDPFWLVQRTAILSLFLFCAGMGLAIALHQGQHWRRFWWRWGQVAGSALLVTIGSLWMFPRSFIYFGVLHGILVMLVLLRLAAPLGAWLWPLGALAVALPRLVQHPIFDTPWTNWVGLITRKPITEDYVPILPWIGVMAWGLAAGNWVLRHRPQWLTGPLPTSTAPLAVLGRWSLSFYMLHQPVLIGALMLAMLISHHL